MRDVNEVAEYLLYYCEKVLEKPISNLQLQKFLYYIQGLNLALLGKCMFKNEIEAWKYGPVVPDIYYRFSSNSSQEIIGIKPKEEVLSDSEKEIIKFVANNLKDIDPWDLVKSTHEEDPWKNNYFSSFNNVIKVKDIKKWFKSKFKFEE